jgi:glycosyltransferase involved in cell wall biosynthesis
MKIEEIESTSAEVLVSPNKAASPSTCLKVALLTGGMDPHYSIGLACALAESGIKVDFIGSDEHDHPALGRALGLRFYNLRGNHQSNSGQLWKLLKLFIYYLQLLRYAATSTCPIFHILWNNRVEMIDRTLLMIYYKALGKRIAITVHNVNAGRRDGKDSLFNRTTLKYQYLSADCLFVHTSRMKQELIDKFQIRDSAITVIPHPINCVLPDTGLTQTEARHRLNISEKEKVLLFFGAIRPYKGLDDLVTAFAPLVAADSSHRLIIAGAPKKESRQYAEKIQGQIRRNLPSGSAVWRMEFIPDDEAEMYFKAADVLVLPYKEIFQSGVLFIAYGYGLPVIATDVGSFRENICEGETGFICPPNDPQALTQAIQTYFASNLFHKLIQHRAAIRKFALREHSWQQVAVLTQNAYLQTLHLSTRPASGKPSPFQNELS